MTTVYSPSSSTTTTTTTSPVSAHLPLQSRQLRPSKAPLYVPAALRPTERPQRHSPPTPPRSVHGSLDSCDVAATAAATTATTATTEPTTTTPTTTAPSSPHLTTASMVTTGIKRSDSVSKMAEDEWMKNEHLGSVTGLPTKDHWKADRASSNCDSPTCRSSFGLFLRRHHCRHCGHVFCSSHTPHVVPLDQDARFHPEGVLSRACDLCWHAFNRWDDTRGERLTKIQSVIDAQSDSESDVSHDEASEPVSGSSSGSGSDPAPTPAPAKPALPMQDIAASIPRGWNWSTF